MGTPQYRIEFVGESNLPEVDAKLAEYDQEWAFCRFGRGGDTTLYIRSVARGRADDAMASLLEEAWEGYRALSAADLVDLARASSGVAEHGREAV